MKRRFDISIAVLTCLLFLAACSGSYSGYHFSYPPGSEPHENNWTHLGKILVWDPYGKGTTDRAEKKVEITIVDKNKKNILRHKIKQTSASISQEVYWEEFGRITIKLFEVGNKYAEDQYNKHLVEQGPKHLITLSFSWDGDKFVYTPNKSLKERDALKRAP